MDERHKGRILLVEDDARYAERLARNLALDGFAVDVAASGEAALEALCSVRPDLVLTDLKMPGMSGIELLERIKSGRHPGVDADVPVVVLTSMDSARLAVESLKKGAADYLTKEGERDEISLRVARVIRESRLARQNALLRDQIRTQSEFGEMVAVSAAMQRVLEEVRQVADSDATVLVRGETGVGKELVARALHNLSSRRDQVFLEVNCAALPDDNMFQSELFGHERGAFTGADVQKKGRFELAGEGTLFLDEVGDLSLDCQGKILRAVENREITRLGGEKKIRVDARFIFATHRDLAREVERGRFREDLLYRINVIQIHIPPLRERPEDIDALAQHFLFRFAERYRRTPLLLEEDARRQLAAHAWRGNARELRNLMERLVLTHPGERVTAADLVAGGIAGRPSDGLFRLPPGGMALEDLERHAILSALEQSGWVQKDAAALLSISPDRLLSRIRKFGITHPSWRIHRGSEDSCHES
ncbi:sigma-54-dependent Fis family transcriptional regulator [bacterium]|nr:sigma-54-dependent Fis family transcriptional regulator [bacterium]